MASKTEVAQLEDEIETFETEPKDDGKPAEGEEARNYAKELQDRIAALSAQVGRGRRMRRGGTRSVAFESEGKASTPSESVRMG